MNTVFHRARTRSDPFAPSPVGRRDWFAIALLALVVAVLFAPFFADLDKLPESRDMAKLTDQVALFRITVGDYHEFPLRTHLVGGGYAIIGHPYDPTFHPLAPLTLLIGERLWVRLNVFLLYLAGTIACYGLARRVLRLSIAGSLVAALAFATCTWAPEQINDGNLGKIYSLLFPALLYAYHRGKSDPRWIFGGAVAWFLVFTNGAIVVMAMDLAFGLYVALDLIADRRKTGRAIAAAALIVGLGACFSVGKLVPELELYRSKVEPIHHDQEENYAKIREQIVVPTPAGMALGMTTTPWLDGRDWDMTAFFGYGALLLIPIGLVRRRRRMWPHAVLAGFLLVVCLGPPVAGPLFDLLWHTVPGFKYMLKVPKFFLPYAIVELALLAGAALSPRTTTASRPGRVADWALLAVALVGSAHALYASRWFLTDNFRIPFPEADEPPEFFQVYFPGFEARNLDFRAQKMAYISKDEYWLHLHHKGTINWTSNFILPEPAVPRVFLDASTRKDYVPRPTSTGRLNPGYRGEAWFDGEDGDATLEAISPNRITVRVDVRSPGTVVVNQNYHPGWRCDEREVGESGGLLAFQYDSPVSETIHLRYRPADHIAAIAAGLAAFFASAVVVFRILPRRRRRSAAPDPPDEAR